MFYVHRYSIVEADRGENGNIIITDELGNKREINDKDFYDDYIVVRKLRKTRTADIDILSKGYMEMGKLVKESNENNDDYIFDLNELNHKAV